MKTLSVIVVLSIASWSQMASAAVICQLTGTINIQSLDSYYCDSSHVGYCSTWKEVDLDSNNRPLKYMRVGVYDHVVGGTLKGVGSTGSNGTYAVLWNAPSCTGSVELALTYQRVHEDDTLNNPRYRFEMTTPSGSNYYTAFAINLTGATTTFNFTFPRTTGDPDSTTKIANIYYTANSVVSEMVTWHSSIDSSFATNLADTLEIHYDPTAGGGAFNDPWEWYINLPGSEYNAGTVLRHEFGHLAYTTLLRFHQATNCGTYNFGIANGQHNLRSCEWGAAAYNEGMATFLAVRSMAINADQNVWDCFCHSNANQDVCSEVATTASTDSDRIVDCAAGIFSGVGDTFATTRSHCVRVLGAAGCQTCTGGSCVACPDTNADGTCDNYQSWGFRNEQNVVRFLWDMIDVHDENGDDDTNESIVSLSAKLYGMTCNANSGFGSDGTCNEPDRAPNCDPASEIGDAVIPMTGTRDSLNAADLGDLIPGSQSSERNVNCIDGSED